MKLRAYLHELDKAKAADSGVQAATDRYHEATRQLAAEVKEKIEQVLDGSGLGFSPNELVYAASARCRCGAGLAYPDGIGMHGAWYCSAVLLGEAAEGEHPNYPFAFYEMKSEGQPSAYGSSTRPSGSHIVREVWWVCKKCQGSGIRADNEDRDFACTECGAPSLNPNGSGSNNLLTRYFSVAFLGEEQNDDTN